MRTFLVVVLALATLTAAPVGAYEPERTPQRDAAASGQRFLAEGPVRGTTAALAIRRGGETLFARNADRRMVPASLMKLVTTTAGVHLFGPDHRFTTRVMATGSTGAVDRLWLVGGGDPTLATEAYRRRRYLPKPTDRFPVPAFATGSPTVEDLAAAVRSAGVTSVGRIVADESLFDDRRTQPGWLQRYLGFDPDTGILSALTVNEARADLGGNILVDEPARAAAQRFRTALRAQGISVGGRITIGRAPAGASEVARVESPPLREIVDFILRYSVNFPSEMLLKSMGAAATGLGTTEAGIAEVRRILDELEIPLGGFVMRDGSGLSVDNRVTARTLASLLDRILTGRGPRWDAVRSGLPVAGGPGTLLGRMTGPPTGGNLVGKTGQIRRVRAMAGWVTAADGIPVVYVAIVNGTPSPFSLTAPLDLLGLLLARFPFA